MKVLFTTYSTLGVGGAEVSMKLLAEGLRKLGNDVIIASTGNYDNARKFRRFRKIPLYSVHNKYLETFFSNIIKKENIEIIHAHDRLTSIAAIRTGKFKIPTVVHFRDYWFACPRSSCLTPDFTEYDVCNYGMILKKYPMKRWLWDMYKWRYIKSKWREIDEADLKFANSGVVKRRLELCGIRKNVKVLPILRDFQNITGDGEGVKKKYGLKKIVITFIGSLHYHKGIMNMLTIMPSILAERGNVSFLIVGDGPLYEEIKNKSYKNVILTGRLKGDEIPDVYEASDIVLLPSVWQEPLSGVLLEAAAHKKVIISSNTGGSSDILDQKFMINPFDLDGWKERILELIDDEKLRNKLGNEWGNIARKKYNIPVIAEQVEKEYENVRDCRV